MKISAKGRYAMAALTYMAQLQPGAPGPAGTGSGTEAVTVIKIAEGLGISKIYLEQTFSLLKRAGLVTSVKGAQGGYFLTRSPEEISAFDILSAVENSLFEETEPTVPALAPHMDAALFSSIFNPLDQAVHQVLASVSLKDITALAQRELERSGYMFFI